MSFSSTFSTDLMMTASNIRYNSSLSTQLLVYRSKYLCNYCCIDQKYCKVWHRCIYKLKFQLKIYVRVSQIYIAHAFYIFQIKRILFIFRDGQSASASKEKISTRSFTFPFIYWIYELNLPLAALHLAWFWEKREKRMVIYTICKIIYALENSARYNVCVSRDCAYFLI